MIGAIKQFFNDRMQMDSEAASAGAEHALNLATAALLIEVMRADFEVVDQEREAVQALLQGRLQLSADEVNELFVLAEQEVVESVSLFQFTSLVDQELSYEHKVRIMNMLWQVVYADNMMDKHEEYLMRKISDLLHISHRDYIQSKHRVMPG